MQGDSSVLEQLNTYNLKVNDDMLRHIISVGAENDRIMTLMCHIVNSHQVWLERISGKSMTVKPFDIRTADELKAQNQSNYELTAEFLKNRDLNERIAYVNLQRKRFENTLAEMFTHLFNHGSYHRGQINQLLVQEGKPAMVSDFIVYNRTEIV